MSDQEKSKAAKGVLWSLVENGGLALVSFTALVLYARYLSVDEFGLFSIVLALVELLGVLVSMLFHDALVQRRHVTELHYDTAFTFSLIFSAVLLVACVLLGPAFEALVATKGAAKILAWTAICFPSSAWSATLVARQRREMSFRPLAIRSLLGRLVGALIGIALVLLGAGIWGLVAQQVLILLVGSAVLWFSATQRPRLRMGATELKELLRFGVYAVSTLFVTFAVKRVFVIIAGLKLGVGLAGYLNLSFRAVDVLWAISAGAVGQVALPVLSRLQSDPERLKHAYRSALEFVCLLMYPCFVGIALTAPEILQLAFGPEWLPSSAYVTALGLLVLVQAPRLLTKPVLTAVGRPRDALIGLGVELGVMLTLLFATGPHTLLWAMAIWITRELVALPVVLYVVRKAAGLTVSDQLKGAVTPFLASGAMAVAVYGLRLSLPASVGVIGLLLVLSTAGAIVYIAATWLIDSSSLTRVKQFLVSSRAAKATA